MTLKGKAVEKATTLPKRILLLDDRCFHTYQLDMPIYRSPSSTVANKFQKELGVRFVYERHLPWYSGSISQPNRGTDSFDEYLTLLNESASDGRVFVDIHHQLTTNPLLFREIKEGYLRSYDLEGIISNFSLHKLCWIRHITQQGDIDGRLDYVVIGDDCNRGMIKAVAVAQNMRGSNACIVKTGYQRINEKPYRQLGYTTFMTNRNFRAYLKSLNP